MKAGRPRIVEVVGVCGAGKSTLVQNLAHLDWELGEFLQLKRVDHLRSVLRALGEVIPLTPFVFRSSTPPSLTDLKLILYLTVWHRRVAGDAGDRGPGLLLDQGPVYAMATLRRPGSPLAGIDATRWWRRIVGRWAETLDAVVWLDAPDEVLWSRVQDRPSDHAIKGRPREVGYEYLRSYRSSFSETLDQLGVPFGPATHHFDTSERSPDRLVREVESVLSAATGADD